MAIASVRFLKVSKVLIADGKKFLFSSAIPNFNSTHRCLAYKYNMVPTACIHRYTAALCMKTLKENENDLSVS